MSFDTYFESLNLRIQNRKALDIIQKRSPTAEDQGATSCCRSGFCCWKRPGALEEADIPKIANFLGITEKSLFEEYLVVDRIEDLCLLPRRKEQEGGKMLNWRETYDIATPCVFLDEENGNACKIHDVKPCDCRAFKCWEPDENAKGATVSEEKLKEIGWDGYRPDDYD
jgi:Fe-S-cluster containining protein